MSIEYDQLGNVIQGSGFDTAIPPGPIISKANAFTHKPGNIVPSSKETYALDFQPNMLDNYDVVTYHWKLFITSTEDARKGTVLSVDKQIVIAESGVSDLTIDKVELHGIAVPSAEAGTGTQTTAKFEIVEPSGAGLLDKMFYESISLGIGNWLVMPCFLQLEFRGRDPLTSSSDSSGAPGGIGSLRWVWPVKLGNVKANVTTVGTRYEFDTILYNELAQTNSYFNIQHNVVLKGLTTFNKAMIDLADKLNADQLEKLIDNYSIPDTYKIVVDPLLQNIPITPAKNNTNTSRAGDFVDFNKKTASYNTGTSIDKIVDSLLSNTAYFQEKMQGSATPTSAPGTSNTVPNQMKSFWRIITETHPIAYDSLRQDNAVEVTIFIIQYDAGAMDVSPSQTGQTPGSIEASKKRLAEYAEKRIFNKIYNYMFTGLNDQVITFDLNMNCSFAAGYARFGGIYADTAQRKGEGVANQNNAEKEKNITEQLRKTLQFVNDADPSDEKNISARISEMQTSINSSTLDDKTKSKYNVLLKNARPADKRAFVKQVQNGGGVNATGKIDPKIEATSLAKPQNSDIPAFISDIDITSPASKEAYQQMITNRKGKLRPIPFRESAQEVNAGYGIDPSSDAGRNRLASIFSTSLYSTLDGSLMQVKLTIKGDPYWLFPQPVNSGETTILYNSVIAARDENQAISNIKEAHTKYDTNAVNLFGTDNFVLIRFRTPRIFNETTGIVDPYTESEMFSGVYKVITVVSKFEMGKFTQELTCILDPVINLADLPGFLKEINVAVQKPSPTLAKSIFGDNSQHITNDLLQFPTTNTNRLASNVQDRTNGLVNSAKSINIPRIG